MSEFQYTNNSRIFEEHPGEVPYLTYPFFSETGLVNHGFSTRLGGVSTGCFESMNLSFSRGDDPERVRENFARFGTAIDVQPEDMVFSKQTHTTNVRVVTEADKGNGILRPVPYDNVDGLVTNIPGICLVTFYADCVPLFFLDPDRKVIALSHSGWRGTVGKIGLETVRVMQKEYGCRPEHILAAVGPSICQDCYEVSVDVIDRFKEAYDQRLWPELFYKKANGRYQLNLWKANESVFLESGILPEHISITNVCTRCNPHILFSHRYMGNERGSLAAFMQLKK